MMKRKQIRIRNTEAKSRIIYCPWESQKKPCPLLQIPSWTSALEDTDAAMKYGKGCHT